MSHATPDFELNKEVSLSGFLNCNIPCKFLQLVYSQITIIQKQKSESQVDGPCKCWEHLKEEN